MDCIIGSILIGCITLLYDNWAALDGELLKDGREKYWHPSLHERCISHANMKSSKDHQGHRSGGPHDGGALNHKMPISKRVSSHRESEWWGMLTYKHLHSGFPSISHHSILWEIYHWLHCAELKNRINQADRFGRTGFICWVNLEFMLNLRRVFKRNPNKITLLGHFSLYSFNWH